jgi:hypothetical protein
MRPLCSWHGRRGREICLRRDGDITHVCLRRSRLRHVNHESRGAGIRHLRVLVRELGLLRVHSIVEICMGPGIDHLATILVYEIHIPPASLLWRHILMTGPVHRGRDWTAIRMLPLYRHAAIGSCCGRGYSSSMLVPV